MNAAAEVFEINGQRIAWRDLLKLRREQRKTAQKAQLTLFELKDDSRPPMQKTASGRLSELTLFDK